MSRWHTIRLFRTKRFRVGLQWCQEDEGETRALTWMDDYDRGKLASGEWTNCCFRVVVYLDGAQVAADYLGNSVYADPADFGREHIGHKGGTYFSDMVREACAAARAHLRTPQPTPPRMRLDTHKTA